MAGIFEIQVFFGNIAFQLASVLDLITCVFFGGAHLMTKPCFSLRVYDK